MSVNYVYRDKNGKEREKILLNPYEKGTKYFKELQDNRHYMNDMKTVKKGKDGKKPLYLSDLQKSYRNGYLQAQKDSREAYKSKNNTQGGVIPYSGNFIDIF